MSFVAPIWLALATAAAVGAVVAHLFSTSRPPQQPLPTARFVPRGTPMAVLRTRRLTDLPLLALRLLAVTLFGLAAAGAHLPRSGPTRVVLVDASRAVTAVHAQHSGADRVIAFDSVARLVDASVLDTLTPSVARGSLSAALVAAHRAIAGVTRGRGDIELAIVSPFAREEVDSATATLVALWEGPVRLTRVAAAAPPSPLRVAVEAEGDDPVAAALAATGSRADAAGVRVVRGAITSMDSAWAREGGVLVHWPASLPAQAGSSAWAVTTARHTVVGAAAPERAPGSGTAVARWSDGRPAATETALGAGCIRDVAITVDPVGDIALRDSFRGLARSLLSPCGGGRDFTPVTDSALLARREPRLSAVAAPQAADTLLPPILALLALLVLAAEQLLRRRRGSA